MAMVSSFLSHFQYWRMLDLQDIIRIYIIGRAYKRANLYTPICCFC